jgi:hypothetical protein
LGYLEALVLFHLRFNIFSITFIAATHSTFWCVCVLCQAFILFFWM